MKQGNATVSLTLDANNQPKTLTVTQQGNQLMSLLFTSFTTDINQVVLAGGGDANWAPPSDQCLQVILFCFLFETKTDA